jgi:uncharacterized protein (DUF433 family)
MKITVTLPDELADKVRDRADRDELIRRAVASALEHEPVHIERTPGVAGGKPRIAHRRITVQDIVSWHERLGRSADEIATEHDLTLAEVHAALAYYFDHREEIDAAMRQSEAFLDDLRRQTPSKLWQKLSEQTRNGRAD